MDKITIVKVSSGKASSGNEFWPKGWIMYALHALPVKGDELAGKLVEAAVNCENEINRGSLNLVENEVKHMAEAKAIAARFGYELVFEEEIISYEELEKRIKAN